MLFNMGGCCGMEAGSCAMMFSERLAWNVNLPLVASHACSEFACMGAACTAGIAGIGSMIVIKKYTYSSLFCLRNRVGFIQSSNNPNLKP